MVWALAMAGRSRAVTAAAASRIVIVSIIAHSDKMARCACTARHFAQYRPFGLAAFLGDRATRMKGAAGWRVDRARKLALQDGALADAGELWIGNGRRCQQGLG